MRKAILLGAIVPLVLVLAAPATADQAPPVRLLSPFGGNPLVCDAPVGSIPAGQAVDAYFPPKDHTRTIGWFAPEGSTTGPFVLFQDLYVLAQMYSADGELVATVEGTWPTKVGLLGTKVTCHTSWEEVDEETGETMLVVFRVDVLVIPDGS